MRCTEKNVKDAGTIIYTMQKFSFRKLEFHVSLELWSDFKVGNCILVKLGGTYVDGTWVYYSKNRIIIFILVFTFIVVLYFKVWELRTLVLTSIQKKFPTILETFRTLTSFWPFFDHLCWQFLPFYIFGPPTHLFF